MNKRQFEVRERELRRYIRDVAEKFIEEPRERWLANLLAQLDIPREKLLERIRALKQQLRIPRAGAQAMALADEIEKAENAIIIIDLLRDLARVGTKAGILVIYETLESFLQKPYTKLTEK